MHDRRRTNELTLLNSSRTQGHISGVQELTSFVSISGGSYSGREGERSVIVHKNAGRNTLALRKELGILELSRRKKTKSPDLHEVKI